MEAKIPRGLRNLPPQKERPSPQSELQQLQQDAAKIERWWTNPRWKHTQRVYSGTNE
jgi:hypothetical protein